MKLFDRRRNVAKKLFLFEGFKMEKESVDLRRFSSDKAVRCAILSFA